MAATSLTGVTPLRPQSTAAVRPYNPQTFANGQVVRSADGSIVDAAAPNFRAADGTTTTLGNVLPQFDAWTHAQGYGAYDNTTGLTDDQNAARMAKYRDLMTGATAPAPASPMATAASTLAPTATPAAGLTPQPPSPTPMPMPTPPRTPKLPTPTPLPMPGPPPVAFGDASPFTGGPASRGDGSPFLPQPPSPVPGPMGGATSGLLSGLLGAGGSLQPPSPVPLPMGGSGTTLGGYGPFNTTGPDTRYAATSSYGPGADLRGTQISPTNSAQTSQAAGATNGALASYTGFQASPFQAVASGSYDPNADTTATRAMLQQALTGLTSGPTRSALASQQMALNNQLDDATFAGEQRQVGQNAAKFGRIGAGLTTNDLSGVLQSHDLTRSNSARQLALDAATGEIGDRLNNLNAISGVTSLLGNEDRSNAGVSLGLRNEARSEGDRRGAYDTADFNRRGQLFGDTAGYQANREANDASRRDELRGERTYQTGQEQTAYDRNRQATLDAQSQSNNALTQGLALLGAGNGSDLSGLLAGLGASGSASAQSGYGDVAKLLAQWAATRKTS